MASEWERSRTMGRQARRKRQHRGEGESRPTVQQISQAWLGKRVVFDAGRGDGVQQGMVVQVMDDGSVLVECLPEYRGRVVAVALTSGYLDRLTLIDG